MNRDRVELLGWIGVAVVLVALTIPWFLWGVDAVVAGLPVWLWWHVGWMCLASLVFWLFARRAWGIGIETSDGSRGRTGSRGGGRDGNRRERGGRDRVASGRGESR